MKLLKILLSTVLASGLLMVPAETYADKTNRHYEAIPGPYNHLITAIHRHSNGLIWVGTDTGLCRYDGYNVTPAPTAFPDSITIINEHIQKICEDSTGRLWIKAQDGYGIYDPNQCTVDDTLEKALKAAGITNGYITEIEADKDGSIWVAIGGEGIYKIPGGTGKAIKSDYKVNDDFNVCCIVFNQYGSPVCVDESGRLTWIDPGSLKVTDEVNPQHPLGVNRKGNYELAVDNLNRYWLYSTHMLEVYDGTAEKWITDKISVQDKQGTIKQIHQDKKGRLMLARDNRGVEQIQTVGDQIRFVTVDTPSDITYKNTITCFLDDQSGTNWMGTYKKGILSDNECIHKFGLESLPDVNCMLAENGNIVWVGTDKSGLWRWNTSTGEKIPIQDPSEGNSPSAITSLVVTPDNTLYVGSFAYGLRRVRNGVFEKVKTGTALDNSFAWSLAPDGEGGIWISTLGAGVFHYNPETGHTKHYSDTTTYTPALYVNSGIKSKDGRFYFGHSYGICYVDPDDGQIHDLKDLNDNLDTTGWRIVQLFEDSRGLLWAATSHGLKAIDRTHSKITDVRTADGKSTGFITGIIEDNGGLIWTSEGRALTNIRVIYDDKTGEIDFATRSYDTEDGLMDSDFNQRSFAKLHSGEILVGGLYGANRFKPAEVKYNSTTPKVIFTDLFVDNKPALPGDKRGGTTIINQALYTGGHIDIPHSAKDFTIYFTTDNYALPDKTTYSYKLEGYDDEWRTLPSGQHSVTYTNLSSGSYKLLVKGINSDGYESHVPASLEINVLPPFWESPWAIALYVLLLGLAIWGIVVLIEKIEKRKFKRKVEEEEHKKQEEINQLKFQFFTNVSHDLRTPLTLIVSPLDEMIKETGDPRQQKRLTLLKDNALKLLALVNQLLDFRKNEVTGLRFTPIEADIVKACRGICDSFLPLSERKKVNLSFYSDHNEIFMAFDEDKLQKILMNLLSNAFKFTPPYGRVDVSLEQVGTEKPVLRIKVADTGSGIRDTDKERIFESFYQADGKGAEEAQTGSGIGLSMVREYVKLHQGTVRVTDNVGCGSVFIIDLPIMHLDHTTQGDSLGALSFLDIDDEPEEIDNNDRTENTDEEDSEEETSDDNLPIALVVDDNPDMTEMLSFELEKDFTVVTAEDGYAALKAIERERPAIILTDLMMPGMDGIELCRKLKSDPETVDIPLVILTAKHDLGVKIEGLTIGADDYITKPFNLDVLRLRMKRLIKLNEKGATRTLIDPEPEVIKITPLDEKLIEKAMKYVSDNIDSPKLSVEELSDYLGMSRVRLYKKIKQITGKTPIEFIRIIRLKRAAQLLRESQLNVSEIAYRTGFNSPKVFSKYFKEEFGILPSLYQDKEGTETNYPV